MWKSSYICSLLIICADARELLIGDSEKLLQLPMDNILGEDPVFHPYFELDANVSRVFLLANHCI